MNYAIYNNKVYVANIREMKVRLKTRIAENGFMELVDSGGNIHNDIFIKEVEIDNINMIYELEYRVKYKGKEYKCLGIGKFILNFNNITIFTNESTVAEQYKFIKKEQFIYEKDVSLDEIEALIEIKRPLLKFKSMGEVITRIEQKDLRNYLSNIIE